MASEQFVLWESEPAREFSDAHLLGNGSLGASVTGGIPYENILINHDTLWSGQERDKLTPDTRARLDEARALTLEGRYHEATELINHYMLGYWSESYLPLGYLNLTVNLGEDRRLMGQKRILEGEFPYSGYSRKLDITRAVETIEYDHLDRHYTRRMFVSAPDNVLAVRMEASGKGLTFAISMDSPLRHEQALSDDGAAAYGRAPDRVEPYGPKYTPNIVYHRDDESDALRFATACRVIDTDGEIAGDEMRLYVRNASYAVIVCAAETNFKGVGVPRDKDTSKLLALCESTLDGARAKGWDKLLADHVHEYQSLYNRVSIDLGPALTGGMTASSRLAASASIDDPAMLALIIQYCRYLLLAFSRPGTQAGNLQGIWNPLVYPSWACNYTTNINVQMNYWCAEPLALPECHMPMIDLVRGCADTGNAAARELYGVEGWVTHHNTDLWRFAALAGEDASWAWWPFGGFWMAQHLWTHYEFTGDEAFLRETALPVLREAARFLCGFVIKDKKGRYVTAPSTSPENKFFMPGRSFEDCPDQVRAGNRMSPNRDDTAEVSKSSTMDIAITREILRNYITAAALLGEDDPLLERCAEVAANLYPYQIGKHGQLQEWEEDFDECTPGMSHLSHMYPIYPGDEIGLDRTDGLFQAARIALERRERHGASGNGWPGAWRIALWARFRDADKANRLNGTMGKRLGASLLLEKHLQIDAIMGWGAGLTEMLIQSRCGSASELPGAPDRIDLMPAVPKSWRQGSLKGLRARGGYTVSYSWSNGRLAGVEISAAKDGEVVVTAPEAEARFTIKRGQTMRLDGMLKII
jgi:alpha-L-fucosidase 2